MSNSSYTYLAFIHDDSNASIETLKLKLLDFYEQQESELHPEILLDKVNLTLTFSDGYSFYITITEGDTVHEEAIEMSEQVQLDWNEEPINSVKLKECRKRFEMHGDPDFDMDYFNDSLFILEQVETFTGVIIFALG